jgi:hypothetical protein
VVKNNEVGWQQIAGAMTKIRNALDRIGKGCAFAFKADIFSKALGAGTLAFVRLHGIGLICYTDENSHREIRNVYFTRLLIPKIQHFYCT